MLVYTYENNEYCVAKEKAVHHYADLIAKVFEENSRNSRRVSNANYGRLRLAGAQVKIAWLWIGEEWGVQTLGFLRTS